VGRAERLHEVTLYSAIRDVYLETICENQQLVTGQEVEKFTFPRYGAP
jgi:hypothetical protein